MANVCGQRPNGAARTKVFLGQVGPFWFRFEKENSFVLLSVLQDPKIVISKYSIALDASLHTARPKIAHTKQAVSFSIQPLHQVFPPG